MISAFEKVYGPSYQEEKEQTLKELRALLLTYPASRKRARAYIKNASRFIEQE
jgi:hypothetical protein